ncbi:MAG: fasciclin domain-containing protein [Synechococcales cyanobacterium CRU_2_2]|nr:fasciclin domain-containing protein [Synechococcales cyanobacterium CRU_2_2]
MFSRFALVSIVSLGSIGIVGAGVKPTQAKPLQVPSASEVPAAKAPATSLGSVVEVASKNSAFKTLVAAVEAAGLVDKLSEDGPFTILAPTDEAFAELPAGVLQALLLPENKDLLTQILTYHVVPEKLKFEQFRSGALATLNGGVAVNLTSDRIVINNASIIQADVEADNGIIQVISRVLIPPKVAEELQTRLASATPAEPEAPMAEAEASPQRADSTEPAAKPSVRGALVAPALL